MKIIGLSGKSGCGKDTLASVLAASLDGAAVAFTDPLKDAAMAIFSLTRSQVHGPGRGVYDSRWGMTPRNILQRLGTEAIRGEFGPDIWRRSMARRLDVMADEGHWLVFLTDVRFPSEVDFIRSRGGSLVRITRSGLGPAGIEGHESETALDDFGGWDIVVANDGTIAEAVGKITAAGDKAGWWQK